MIGAVQTLCSVLSPALKCASSVNVSPAESVTLLTVATAELQTPVSTTRRLPVSVLDVSATARLLAVPRVARGLLHEGRCRRARWGSPRWTARTRGSVPTALVAVTVNV